LIFILAQIFGIAILPYKSIQRTNIYTTTIKTHKYNTITQIQELFTQYKYTAKIINEKFTHYCITKSDTEEKN